MRITLVILLMFAGKLIFSQNIRFELGINPYSIYSDDTPSSFFPSNLASISNKPMKLTVFLSKFNLNLGRNTVGYDCDCDPRNGSVARGEVTDRAYQLIYLTIGQTYNLNPKFNFNINTGLARRYNTEKFVGDRIFVEYIQTPDFEEVIYDNISYSDFGLMGEVQLAYNFFENLDINISSQYFNFFENHKAVGTFMIGIGASF